MGIIHKNIAKGNDEKSKQTTPFREPRLVRRGTAGFAEHGLRAGLSIGSQSRARPLQRFEAAFAVNQGGTA